MRSAARSAGLCPAFALIALIAATAVVVASALGEFAPDLDCVKRQVCGASGP